MSDDGTDRWHHPASLVQSRSPTTSSGHTLLPPHRDYIDGYIAPRIKVNWTKTTVVKTRVDGTTTVEVGYSLKVAI